MTNLYDANREWSTRPNDERFLSLEDLLAATKIRHEESWTAQADVPSLKAVVTDADEDGNGRFQLQLLDRTRGEEVLLDPTFHSFGQFARLAKAPAGYLRQLPPLLAAVNVTYGLTHNAEQEKTLLLARDGKARAFTGVTYGRIWNEQVVESVIAVNGDGRWQVPSASYSSTDPKRATTLYASHDAGDVFIFLVDPVNEIEVAGRRYHRGFLTSNTELGDASYVLKTFLYDYVCDNRIIWDATDVQELRIRHTGGAPERFAYEGAGYLTRYAEESTVKVVRQIEAAAAFEIPTPKDAKKEPAVAFLQKLGFSAPVAKKSFDFAIAEEGKAETLLDVVNGVTAYARSIPFADTRIELEERAGSLLSIVKDDVARPKSYATV